MNALAFPVVSILVTFGVLTPLLTVGAAWALRRHRRQARSLPQMGGASTFAWLLVPTLLPWVWLVSSAWHQVEPARVVEFCSIEHAAAACVDAVLTLCLAVGIGALALMHRAWRDRVRLDCERVAQQAPSRRRVDAIVARTDALRGVRVVVVRSAPDPVFAVGWLRPRIYVDASFVSRVDDEVLCAALLHECAHVRSRDMWRVSMVRLGLLLNPVAFLLRHEFSHWRQAREASCDQDAVAYGADPLAMVEALVCAARHTRSGVAGAAHLCDHGMAVLKLRLNLLMEGPAAPQRSWGHVVMLGWVVLAMALPHVPGWGGLDWIHVYVERLL